MSASLRVAVIGLGAMGRNHARVWTEIEKVELVGVADPDEAAVVRVTHGRALTGYESSEQMLDEVKPDAVSIAVPTSMHREVAIAAMERGVAVLIEKPLAGTVADARAIVECARRTGVLANVGHIERYNPAILELERRLQDAPLGTIFKITARRTGPFATRIRDVGVAVDLATHDIDIMRWLVGSPITRVYAETAQKLHSQHEDLFTGLFRFENGVVGLLDVNWLTPTKIRELSVAGERGMFVVDYLTQDLTFYENSQADTGFDSLAMVSGVSEGNMIRYAIQRVEPLRAELEAFVAAVQGSCSVGVSLEDGLTAVSLAEWSLLSAREGRALSLDVSANLL